MVHSEKLIIIPILLASLLAVFPLANAQYQTEQTAVFTVPASGIEHISQVGTSGVSFDIEASPGSSGSVTVATYLENPQPNAVLPEGISLEHFTVVTFDMDPTNFVQATVTIHYSNNDVQGLTPPLALFKYVPEANLYGLYARTVADPASKTLTATLTSPTGTLFAIGNAVPISSSPSSSSTIPGSTGTDYTIWILEAIVIILVIIVAVVVALVFLRTPRHPRPRLDSR